MTASNSFTPQERLESLKAGGLSGAVAAAVALGLTLLNTLLGQGPAALIPVNLGAAAISGALFGVTYRYIVRQDGNPQLAAGAVGAFGLVRGLAQLEVRLSQPPIPPVWWLALTLVESLLLFALIKTLLQVALTRGWIQPFGAAPD